MVTLSETAWEIAATTPDPELPMLTLADLGILRGVDAEGDRVVATITPTYSGCPAMREMSMDVRRRLVAAGFAEVEIRTQLAPPWTSDWITPDGRRKLAEAGIAPPKPAPAQAHRLTLQLTPRRDVVCPACGSVRTARVSEFGATACKALYRCEECREPFEYVKEI